MVIVIQETLDIPIYRQIRDQIVQGISDGRLQPGEKLPTVRALAQEAGVNTMTVSKAYQLLRQQGYICAGRRSGAHVCASFVDTPRLSPESKALLARIISEARVAGMTLEDFLQECRACYEGAAVTGEVQSC